MFGQTALVLGGGGSAGNAWEVGVIAGLCEAGLDVINADVIVGTSAGATVAAQVTGPSSPTDLYAGILAEAPGPVAVSEEHRHDRTRAAQDVMRRTSEIIASATDPADMRRRMGKAFLAATALTDSSGQWRATVATRLPSPNWPGRRVLIVAVDAETGEPVVFDGTSGIDLIDAVAASTSNGRAYRIGGRRYFDGGYRRNENADLAAGHQRVLVLSPFGGRSRHPARWRMQLAAQVDDLRAGGSAVHTICPDSESKQLFGPNAMDLSMRPRAARAGHELGRTLAAEIGDFWR